MRPAIELYSLGDVTDSRIRKRSCQLLAGQQLANVFLFQTGPSGGGDDGAGVGLGGMAQIV